MKRQKKNRNKKWIWVVALGAAVVVCVLLAGALNRWFGGQKIELDAEYCHTDKGFVELTAEKYESLIQEKGSFVVFIDQSGCTTADRLRKYAEIYMEQNKIAIYTIMFENMKNTSLHDYVKYYPSVAIIDKGSVKAYLRADNNEDAKIYNNYDDFERWLNERLQK